ncbi:VOC family protein [Alteriqipengyuania sp.]|uniref:VOC family protein n=1 Tax=Alteriqipengyuania sp. TaxID=2800692 RepID=UPI003519405F
MPDTHGDFVWYELMTTNADAAQAFYGPLLGWEFKGSDTPGMDYRLISKDGVEIAGLLQLTQEMTDGGARPIWVGYISVEEIEAGVAKLKELGGTVLMGPNHLDGVGHMAFVSDPQGVPFYLMQPEGPEGQESQSFAKHAPREGHCAWNELVTTDPAAAKQFYTSLFGWEKSDEMDMGPMGLYEMYSVNGYTLGAMMAKPEMMPASAWIYYLRVPDIEAAAAFVRENGGQVMTDPMEIPGGDYILNGLDPQGAFFALIGTKGS